MRSALCFLAGIAALATLSACGERAPTTSGPGEPPAAAVDSALPEGAVRPKFTSQLTRKGDPPWQQIMRQADGSVIQFAPGTIFRYPADGTAEAQIQILHPTAQSGVIAVGGVDTPVSFHRERYQYLMDCPGRRFTILRREIMAGLSGDVVAGSEALDEREQPDWRAVQEGGPAHLLFPPTCEAA